MNPGWDVPPKRGKQMAIGSMSYRLFIKVRGMTPYFKEGHYTSKNVAVQAARSVIEGDMDVDFVNVYEQRHVKRFSRSCIVEEG